MNRHAPLPLLLLTLLAACGGGGGEEATNNPDNSTTTTLPSKTSPFLYSDLITRTTGALAAPWNRYFVTTYSPTALATVRTRYATYRNSTLARDPMLSARVDYAHSVGLTGAGEIITIVDDGIYAQHDQFNGKGLVRLGSNDTGYHGTAVASVAAGNGTAQMTGVAPNADLISAAFSYDVGLDWTSLASMMNYAKSAGSIVANNSWGLSDGTADAPSTLTYSEIQADFASYVASDADFRSYIDSLRSFATTGVIVFAQSNDISGSSSAIATLPTLETQLSGPSTLQNSWITVINAIPTYNINTNQITGAVTVSEQCREAAAYCMAANGNLYAAYYNEANPRSGAYALFDGASFAAPQVAGAIALLAEAFPDLTASQLRDRLLATADNDFFLADPDVSELTFTGGVKHKYSLKYGHGFLDLSAALLPIGTSYIPMASGEMLSLSQPLIAGGPASGPAIQDALRGTEFAFGDSMGGAFTAPAELLATSTALPSAETLSLSQISATDLSAHRAETRRAIEDGTALSGLSQATGLSAMTLLGATPLTLDTADQSTRLTAYVAEGTTTPEGLALSHSFDLGLGSLSVNVGSGYLKGSVLGVTAPGREKAIASDMRFLGLDYTAALEGGNSISLGGEFGVASGNGAGLVRDLGTLAYDSVKIAWNQTEVATTGDTLSLFLRRPVGIRSGAATLDLATNVSALSAIPSAAGFTDTTIDLAPKDRQLDLGFEYAAPMGERADIVFAMTYAENLGHRSGQSDVAGSVGLQLRF